MVAPATTWILAGIATAMLPGLTMAQDSRNQGYLVDSFGNNITTSANTGLCWRSSDWTPARSAEPCDPVGVKSQAAAPRVAAAAAPPAPPAAPPPATASAPPQSVSFSADALFAFDKYELKPEGKAALDEFARELGGARYEVIVATGHTDRFGSHEYNQRLSERRASAVKEYLVSREIPAARVTAEGRGETQPATRPGECQGAKSVKIIACLQPDRRVHVEVTGTRALTTGSR